jgi:hypothetical protein
MDSVGLAFGNKVFESPSVDLLLETTKGSPRRDDLKKSCFIHKSS